jgi:cytochrome c553
MKRYFLALAGTLLAAAAVTSHAADLNAGKTAFEKHGCVACHGVDAKTPTNPGYPVLAGQHADYLAHALTAYQRGQSGAGASANVRKNPIMGSFAVQLSAEEVDNVTAWLASLPSDLGVRK